MVDISSYVYGKIYSEHVRHVINIYLYTVEPLLTDPPRGGSSPRNGHCIKHRLKIP